MDISTIRFQNVYEWCLRTVGKGICTCDPNNAPEIIKTADFTKVNLESNCVIHGKGWWKSSFEDTYDYYERYNNHQE